MIIRTEMESDFIAIRRLHRAAFGGDDEARLVDLLRDAGGLAISLVAEDAGQIIGHVALSPMQRRPEQIISFGLAPMAVIPEKQKQGVGSALVEAAISAAEDAGACGIFVLGHPEYYPRFGFTPAHNHGLRSVYEVPAEAFMLLKLKSDGLAAYYGVVRYHEVFDGFGA